MAAIAKQRLITIEEFLKNYQGSRFQFHEGHVWESQAVTPDHSYLQASLGEVLRSQFNKTGGPKVPGGWWIYTEVAVKYGESSVFCHDLAGWRRARCPERPRRFPIEDRPDWVCEILSTNEANDLIKKKSVLHRHQVPYYWVVEPSERVITVFEWSEKGYVSILDVVEGFAGRIPPFDAVALKAGVLFGEEDE